MPPHILHGCLCLHVRWFHHHWCAIPLQRDDTGITLHCDLMVGCLDIVRGVLVLILRRLLIYVVLLSIGVFGHLLHPCLSSPVHSAACSFGRRCFHVLTSHGSSDSRLCSCSHVCLSRWPSRDSHHFSKSHWSPVMVDRSMSLSHCLRSYRSSSRFVWNSHSSS